MSGKAIATLTPTAALATVSFVPGEPLNARFREIRVTGPAGPAGLSAYEVAAANGFAGTEAEWLASLAGPTSAILLVAGAALSGQRAVMINADGEAAYPSLADPGHGPQIAGLTEGAALAGAQVSVRFNGAFTEPGWAWVRGPVFAGDNGVLTQAPPAGAWIRQIGVAVSATRIIVDLQPVILT